MWLKKPCPRTSGTREAPTAGERQLITTTHCQQEPHSPLGNQSRHADVFCQGDGCRCVRPEPFLYMCWCPLHLQTQDAQLQKGACVPVLFEKNNVPALLWRAEFRESDRIISKELHCKVLISPSPQVQLWECWQRWLSVRVSSSFRYGENCEKYKTLNFTNYY